MPMWAMFLNASSFLSQRVPADSGSLGDPPSFPRWALLYPSLPSVKRWRSGRGSHSSYHSVVLLFGLSETYSESFTVSYFWPSLREEVCLPAPSSYSSAALNAWCCLSGRLGVSSANQGGKGYILPMSASHARFPYVRLHLSAVDRYLPPETWKSNFSMRPKKPNLFKS